MSSLLNDVLQEAEQGSDLWLKIRIGKFTSFEIHRLIHTKTLTDTNWKYITEKVAENLTGETKEFTNEATAWGIEKEPEAANAFALKTGMILSKCGFTIKSEYYGGSPDRLIEEDGLVEIKCPFNSANHTKHCLIKSEKEFKSECKEYYWQIQSNLNVTDRSYAFFVSYDPRVKQCPLFILLVKRNEKDIAILNRCVEEGTKELKQSLDFLNSH